MRQHLTSEHSKTILRLGIPIMLGQFGVILVGFVDNIMIGRYGTLELAAASFVNGWINLAFVVSIGFSYALTPLVSGSYATANGALKTLLKSGLLANLIVGLGLFVVMGLCLINLHWFGQPEELLPLIRPYYLIQLISLLPVALFNGFKQFVDAVGETKTGMMAVIVANVFNIIFNYLLIFGKAGLPELGLIGAGIATLGARVLSLMIVYYVVHHSGRFREIFEKTKSRAGALQRATIRRIFHLGTPSAIQMGLEAGAFSVAVIMVGWLGSAELAAHQIVQTMGTLGFMMFYGMSSAVSIMVGRYHQLKRAGELRAVVRSGLYIQLLMALTVIVLIISLRNRLGSYFGGDAEVQAIVSLLVYPLAGYQIFDMLQILFASTLRGMQDVRFTAIAAFVCYIFITIGSAYYFGFILQWGVVGVWLSFPIGFICLSSALIIRYRILVKRLQRSTSTARV